MVHKVHAGQRLALASPGVVADALYLLVALAPDTPHQQQRRGNPGARACMSPGHDPDTQLAECGARTLARLGAAAAASRGQTARPFFLGVGLHKPHVPWDVPVEWYNKYPLESVELAPHRSPPLQVCGERWIAALHA